jgi:CubicO group peptidase (beta-lactamase class C family)
MVKAIVILFFLTAQICWADTAPSLDSILDAIRVKYKLPALAGAVFSTDGITEMAATGVRKAGTDVPVTINDLWHLGSDTKMMTALLAGSYVAEGKLSWNDNVLFFFPQLTDKIAPAIKDITIAQVLHHEAGLSENLSLWSRTFLSGTPSEQRLQAVATILKYPTYSPGTYHYANNDYILIGAILEKIGGKPWEDLIRERIFQPLGMSSVGFGGLGTRGQIDQPWPHSGTGNPMLMNGPSIDNPEYVNPAGRVHCTMQDWAKFLIDQLKGGSGMKALLPNEIYTAMQTPAPPGDYGFGWEVLDRPWAGGKALTHAGSNTMNYCVCWLAPAKKFGVLVCTNQGASDATSKACDEASWAMTQRYLVKP